MSKKKIIIILSSVLAILIVGISYAWFTAKDQVKNSFSTATTDNPNNPDDGVKIDENWNPKDAEKISPGADVNKDVRVQNTASYKSFIRVKLVKEFVKAESGINISDLDINKITLNYNTSNVTDINQLSDGKWVDGQDGYFYYLGVVDSKEYTTYLLDSVKLDKYIDNTYRNCGYDVNVIAESIQASNGAAKAVWTNTNLDVINKLTSLEENN